MKKIVITTPSSVSEETYGYILENALKKFSADTAEHILDDSLICGFTIAADGKIYDNSIKMRFDKLKEFINAGGSNG